MVLLAYFAQLYVNDADVTANRLALQAGLAFYFLLFWIMPLVREWLHAGDPERWRRPAADFIREDDAAARIIGDVNKYVYPLSVSTPLLTLRISVEVWPGDQVSDLAWGLITLGAAALFVLCFRLLGRRQGLERLAHVQFLVSLLLLSIALVLLLDGEVLYFSLVGQAVVLHLAARRFADRGTRRYAHALSALLAAWFAYQMTSPAVGTALVNTVALAQLSAVAAAFGVSFIFNRSRVRDIYRLGAHVALLALLLHELSPLPSGQAYVTIAWGAYGIALLVTGMILNLRRLNLAAMITLMAVVAKLLLVDLAYLEAFWRVLLFLGFGALFLLLSFFFQKRTGAGGRFTSHAGNAG